MLAELRALRHEVAALRASSSSHAVPSPPDQQPTPGDDSATTGHAALPPLRIPAGVQASGMPATAAAGGTRVPVDRQSGNRSQSGDVAAKADTTVSATGAGFGGEAGWLKGTTKIAAPGLPAATPQSGP